MSGYSRKQGFTLNGSFVFFLNKHHLSNSLISHHNHLWIISSEIDTEPTFHELYVEWDIGNMRWKKGLLKGKALYNQREVCLQVLFHWDLRLLPTKCGWKEILTPASLLVNWDQETKTDWKVCFKKWDVEVIAWSLETSMFSHNFHSK